jgi:hypothetical protein
MMVYLVLDWDRYYIQLVWPIVLIELYGLRVIVRWASKRNWWSWRYQALMLIGGVVVGLGMVELGLRLANYPWGRCNVVTDASEYKSGHFEPIRGWGYEAGTRSSQDGIVYRFGQDGQRVSDEVGGQQVAKESKKILVVGDSILFGHRLNFEDTFGAKLQKKLGNKYEVMNFSVQGYGTDQIYLTMVSLIEKYKPYMIITDYIADHNKRNVSSDRGYMFPCTRFSGTKPVFELIQDDKLSLTKFPSEYGKYQDFKLGVLWRRFNESRKLVDWNYQDKLTKELMKVMDSLALQNNVKLITINFDSPLTDYQKNRRDEGEAVVELNYQNNSSLYLDDKVHPNTLGTTKMVTDFWNKYKKNF